MYVWEIKFEELWDDDDYFDEGPEWVVAAKSYEEALRKAEKLALSKDRAFEDDETGEMHRVAKVRLIRIKRGKELDA
jgi:hypothetical protein